MDIFSVTDGETFVHLGEYIFPFNMVYTVIQDFLDEDAYKIGGEFVSVWIENEMLRSALDKAEVTSLSYTDRSEIGINFGWFSDVIEKKYAELAV